MVLIGLLLVYLVPFDAKATRDDDVTTLASVVIGK